MLRRVLSCALSALVALAPLFMLAGRLDAMPEFARAYDMPCGACHVHIPKLNSFGKQFAANGYRIPGVVKRPTLPASLWISEYGRMNGDSSPNAKAVLNRMKVVAAGPIGTSGGFMVEWNPVYRDFVADGGTHEANHHIEDFFAFFGLKGNLTITAGQFRPMAQIDTSEKVFLSEALVFSKHLPGKDPHDGFAPSSRTPALRLQKHWPSGPDSTEGNFLSLAVPFKGMLSPAAGSGGSSDISELSSQPRGLFIEGFQRRSEGSLGAHVFLGESGRSLLGVSGEGKLGMAFWEASIAKAHWQGGWEWRSSASLAWIPSTALAAAVRIDQSHVRGESPTLSPLVSFVAPMGSATGRVILEGRITEHKFPTWVIELRALY